MKKKKQTRNRLSKYDDLETGIKKLEGQRDVKNCWGYGKQARQMNFVLALMKLTAKCVTNLSQEEKKLKEAKRKLL